MSAASDNPMKAATEQWSKVVNAHADRVKALTRASQVVAGGTTAYGPSAEGVMAYGGLDPQMFEIVSGVVANNQAKFEPEGTGGLAEHGAPGFKVQGHPPIEP